MLEIEEKIRRLDGRIKHLAEWKPEDLKDICDEVQQLMEGYIIVRNKPRHRPKT